ncbi:MAG: hypothetical protein MJ196_09725 [Treponemataceae bacterium]|nr:hypothetical protein [Treponemataceae bacterium]
METETILGNLKEISDESGRDFFDLSSNFPVLVSELNFIKNSETDDAFDNPKLAKFKQVQGSLTNIIQKQTEIVEQNKQVASNFKSRNTELVESFTKRMELLASMNELIQRIKDESSEMELISLNAMVVSIKSGKEGQAFSYITSNLKTLSLRLIAQSDALIDNEKAIKENITLLERTISDVERISGKTGDDTGANISIGQALENIMAELASMMEKASSVRQPILKAMECIQMQDIIRQSLDDVILTLSKIKETGSRATDDEKLDQCCFNEQLAKVSITLLESINNKLKASIDVFKQNRDTINSILSDVERQRQNFINSSLTDTSRRDSLQACIERTSAEFGDFVNIFKSYQSAQEQVLEKSSSIQHAVQRIQLCFTDFFPIINNLTYVAIAQRIEVARNTNISTIKTTVDYMSNLIMQTNQNVEDAQKLLQSFIDNSTKQIKQFSTEADADRKFFSAINKTKSMFIKSLSKLQNDFVKAVENFTVYSEDFLMSYRSIEGAIEHLQQLSARFENEQSALKEIYEEAWNEKAKIMKEKGVSEWSIRNSSFNDFIKHFTIVSDKQAVGSITGMEVDAGVEAGEITFF